MSEINKTSQQSLQRILDKIGVKSANEKKEEVNKSTLGQEDFLKLMTTQLQNQDPFAPMENGDFIALKAYEYTGKILGKSLANFVTFTQPEAIILTGGLVHSGDWILEPTKIAFNKNLLPFYKNKVKILLSGLEDKDSAILGSAALVWKNIL